MALLKSFGFSIVKVIGIGLAIGAMSTILAAILVPFVFESRKPQAVLQEPMPNTSVKIEPIRYL